MNLADSPQTHHLPIETGPGTPGGKFLRCYWQPVVLLQDFPVGSAPLALKMLNEELVLFRDEKGTIALLGLRCAHRCADLSYGRIENGGLRCIYHGWLYDAQGNCLEQPGEPEGGKRRGQVKQLSYPCIERGGAVWTYMGAGETPLFPNYPVLSAPDEYRFTARWRSNCNYLQANEGNIDPVHTSYLHSFQPLQEEANSPLALSQQQSVFGVDTAPHVAIEDTRLGVRVFTHRKLPLPGKQLLRVTNFVMPNACAIGGSETPLGRGGMSMFFHVPIDDVSHWRYEFVFHSKAELPKKQLKEAYDAEMDKDGVPWRNQENRFGQDREQMKRSYLGMGPTFPTHDLFVTESQGAILDRSAEHLVTSDIAIVRSRRLLAEAVRNLGSGKDPLGVIRSESDNHFEDLLVLTETVDLNIDLKGYMRQMEAADIYQLSEFQKTEAD